MKSKQLFLLVVAFLLTFPLFQTLADQLVTFEILASFDYPGQSYTYALGLNDHGDVGGYFPHGTLGRRGFVRSAEGEFSSPIIEPDTTGDVTFVTGITNSGTIFGYYLIGVSYQSFFLSGSTFTTYDDIQRAFNVRIWGMNDAGELCGDLQVDYGSPISAFVSIDGRPTAFKIAGSTYNFAYDINNLGQSVGQFGDRVSKSYLREADGSLIWPIKAPGAITTQLYGINDRGWMVGSALDETAAHGVFFASLGNSALFDYPGATTTVFTGINNHGVICGWYRDASGTDHSFLVRVNPASWESAE